MKKIFLLFFISAIFFAAVPAIGQYQFTVSGIVKDSATLELLPGAGIVVKDNPAGTVSDKSGYFNFSFSSKEKQSVIIVKYISFRKKETTVNSGNNNLEIYLQRDIINSQEVNIVGSKIPQSILEAPMTVVRMDLKAIEQLPEENFYTGLASQKGVDLSNASLFYQTINLRGFGTELNEGILQLVDGMDATPPGQGFSVGNLAGANDIDVESVEIVPGSSSAIYGANAFNGLININTKSPFKYQGLTVQIKNGFNYLDNKYHAPALFTDYSVRYAKAFKNRFAFKINLAYLNGTDWLKLSQDDLDPDATDQTRGMNNPGRNIANLYEDEGKLALPIGPDSSDVYVSRTGYNANDLLGEHTNDYRGNISLHYKVTPKTEISYMYSYSVFNTNVGLDGWNFRNFSMQYHKAEIKNDNYFIRAYKISDQDGHSIDAHSLAYLLDDGWKPDSVWSVDFTNAYKGNINGVIPGNFQTARDYADIGRPAAGTDLFNRKVDEYCEILLNDGARYADRSSMYKLLAQYDFSKLFSPVNIICGIDIGSRKLVSHGTMFLDYPGIGPIYDKNYSGYIQAKKENIGKHLDVLASVRIDKFDNFDADITPRIGVVYKIRQKHFIRASFQTGTRNPDPFDQYRYWNFDNIYGVGGTSIQDKKYLLHQRGFDIPSVSDFNDQVNSYVEEHGQDSLNTAIQLFKGLLRPAGLKYIRPEKIKTIEVGYQALLIKNKLHFDIDLFLSFYNHMISNTWIVLPATGNPFNSDSIDAAGASFYDNDVSYFMVAVNADKEVKAWGMEAGAELNFWKNYTLSGNLTLQRSDIDPEIGAYLSSIPPFRTNVSVSNPKLYKNIGFAVNWRWTDSVKRFFNQRDVEIVNGLPAKNIVDAQLSYTLQKLHTLIKVGASNILDHYYSDVPNGSSVGGVYYVSLLYSIK
jgi:iron complex outermembrane receptor protein